MDTLEQVNAKIDEVLTKCPEARPLYEKMSAMTDRELEQLAAEALIATLVGELTPGHLQMLADMAMIIGVQRLVAKQEMAGHPIN